jgi:signal transduction histidine kinase
VHVKGGEETNSDERARGWMGRVRRWLPPWPDIALAAVLLFGSGGVMVAVTSSTPRAAGEATRIATESHIWQLVTLGVLTFLQTAPLAFRRRRPILVLATVVVASVVLSFFGRTPIEVIALWIALYSVAAYTDRKTAIRAGLAALIVLAGPLALNGDLGPIEAIFELGFLALGWMFGAYLGELRGRAERVRREQESEKRRAVAEEQARIARELHDVMAHSVSVMVVQAAAAEDVFDASPDRAREALRSIESTGRHALAEVRRVLDVVRPVGADDRPLEPQPGLSRLGELIGQFRATGLAVALRVEGVRSELPDGIDLSAYRIVQEALTNSLKHGRGVSQAKVLVRYEPGAIDIEVCDDGTGTSSSAIPSEAGVGRGLVGMRERVALYGGHLLAGPRPGGGFEVHARFPLGPEGG